MTSETKTNKSRGHYTEKACQLHCFLQHEGMFSFVSSILAFVSFIPLTTQGRQIGPKVGQIDTKWDKSGTFSDQNSVHFGAVRQNVLNSDLKKSQICQI